MMIKKYECQKCHHEFSKIADSTFIKSVMPQCPVCGSEKVRSSDYIEKKENK